MVKVFHGSILEVDSPLVALGRPNLDFGQGFYLTKLECQARQWATRASRRKLVPAVINVYDFDEVAVKSSYRYCCFEHYDKAWLDFIVANRKGKMLWKDYDVVEGGI